MEEWKGVGIILLFYKLAISQTKMVENRFGLICQKKERKTVTIRPHPL